MPRKRKGVRYSFGSENASSSIPARLYRLKTPREVVTFHIKAYRLVESRLIQMQLRFSGLLKKIESEKRFLWRVKLLDQCDRVAQNYEFLCNRQVFTFGKIYERLTDMSSEEGISKQSIDHAIMWMGHSMEGFENKIRMEEFLQNNDRLRHLRTETENKTKRN